MKVMEVLNERISIPLRGTYYFVRLECGHRVSVLGTLKG